MPVRAAAGLYEPTAAVLIIDTEARPELDHEVLSELFFLTPAEARVTAKLGVGHSAEEIAEETGASLETVRTHIRRVLSKTGTGRQGELISLVLRTAPFAVPEQPHNLLGKAALSKHGAQLRFSSSRTKKVIYTQFWGRIAHAPAFYTRTNRDLGIYEEGWYPYFARRRGLSMKAQQSKKRMTKRLLVLFSALALAGVLLAAVIVEQTPGVPNVFNRLESAFQQQTHFLVFTDSKTAGENAKTATAYYNAIDPPRATGTLSNGYRTRGSSAT